MKVPVAGHLRDKPVIALLLTIQLYANGTTIAPVHSRPASTPYDVVLLFVRTAAELHKEFEPTATRITQTGRLWVVWPRKAGGFVTDVCENAIRDIALATGLVDNKVAALNDAWSGLHVVCRLEDRA